MTNIKSLLHTISVLTLYILSSTSAYAGLVRGKVVDQELNPIAGAACVAFTLPDSTYFDSATSDGHGAFQLNCPEEGAWYAKVSFLGFVPVDIPSSDFAGGDTITVKMTEEASELGEVVVKARRPQLVRKDDALCYTNLDDILQTRVVTSAHDLLKNLPLLDSEDGNAIKLSGAPMGSLVYINGRPSQMDQGQLMQYLKNVPAEQVKEVQILYTPSPKWKTNTAVINVVLKTNDAYSVNGMASVGASYKRDLTVYPGVSVFAGLPKTSINVMYDYTNARGRGKSTSYIRHDVKGTIYDIQDTTMTSRRSQHHALYAEVSHRINDKNTIDASYFGNFSPKGHSANNSINSHFGEYTSNKSSRSAYHGVTLYFSNTKGIDIGMQYMHSSSREWQLMWDDNGTATEQALTGKSRQSVDAVKVYADFTTALPRQWTLTYGAAFNFTHSENSVYNKSNSDDMESADTHSKFEEKKGTAYLGAQRYFFGNKLFARLSLEGELYKIGDYSTNQLMPTVTMMYTPNNTHTFQAQYAELRMFPSYWTRQDYLSYSSPYVINMGNPDLKPMKYHILNLIYVLKSRYSAQLNYYRVNDYFLTQVFMSPEALVQIYRPSNIEFSTAWMLNLSIPVSVSDRFYSNITLNGSHQTFKANDWNGLSFNHKAWTGSVTLKNTVVLSKSPKVTMTVLGRYSSPSITAVLRTGHTWKLDTGLSAELVKGRLSVDVFAYDLLQTAMPYVHMRTGNQWMNIDNNYYARSYYVSLSYKFGGYKSIRQKKPDSSRLGIQ